MKTHDISKCDTQSRLPHKAGASSETHCGAAQDCQYRYYSLNPSPSSNPHSPSSSTTSTHSLSIPENPKESESTSSSATGSSVVLPGSPTEETKDLIASHSLNRSDVEEVEANLESLDGNQRAYWGGVKGKLVYHANKFRDPDYLTRSSMLILSSWPSIQRFAYCCRPTAVNRSGVCKNHEFCPYCNYLRRQDILREYVPAFGKASSWFFLTLSFSGALPFDGPVNAHKCVLYWDVCKQVLQHSIKARTLQGAFWSEELAILNFLPLTVMPHVHAVVVADHMDEDIIKEMEDKASELLAGEENPMRPDFVFKTIATQRSLYDRLRYSLKPMDIIHPYQNAWPTAEENNRANAPTLNSELRELLTGYPLITYRRPSVARKGIFHANHAGYIGVSKSERGEYRDYVENVAASQPEWGASTQEEAA
jgi:hypothetical protein